MLLSNARLDCFAEQRGATPAGMRTFALQHHNSTPMNWFGHQVGPDTLLLFPASGDIDVISRPGFGVSTFSLPIETLSRWFDLYTKSNFDQLAGTGERIYKLSNAQQVKLRKLMNTAAMMARHPDDGTLPADIEIQLLALLHEILTVESGTATTARRANPRTLNRVLDYIRASIREPLTVNELCLVARLSERSLQYLFKRELGMTPRAYMTGQRLSLAHYSLWHAEQGQASVSDIASRAGFTHFGQFAATYRRQYGELPSATLKRTFD